MKKIYLFFLLSLLPFVAYADAVEIDGICYNLVSKVKMAEVISNTSVYNYYSGIIQIPATVTYEDVTYDVTSIGSKAFKGSSNLTSITIPSSVTTIGESAFYGCGSLSSITLYEGLKSIGNKAFWLCSKLTSIDIPNSVTTIGEYAFKSTAITSITIPSGMTTIGRCAFSSCLGLTSIDIPNNIKSIGEYAFDYCTALASVTISNSVTTIGACAFSNCWKLSSISIPNSVTSIGNSAFVSCSNLTSVTLPNSVTSLGESVFKDCSKLTSIEIPSGVTKISNYAFCGCSDLASVTIPDGVTSIGTDAFYYCGKLTSIIIPNSVTAIGGYAFVNSGLTSITIPDNVTLIEVGAFEDCNKLTTITIGSSVNSIGAVCFSNCPELTDVYCYANTIPSTINGTAFNDSYIEYATLHVPAGSLESYKTTAPWSGFKEVVALSAMVKLDKSKLTLEKGKTFTLNATVTPSTLSDKSVTWESSNTKVATVTSDGEVSGVKAGTATITCTSVVSGTKATCKVTVGYVKLDQTEATILKDNIVTLTPTVYPSTLSDKSVTWESSDQEVATVSTNGEVKGIKAGTATITCTSVATGLSTTCQVTVIMGSIKLNKSKVALLKDNTVTLKATLTPTTLEDKSVTWKSSNTKVAMVSSSGKVTAVKTGTATITCTSVALGLSAKCKVTVGKVTLDKSEMILRKGKTEVLTATVYPTTLADKSVTWMSSDTEIATVTTVGKVKGVKDGMVTITCTSNATGLKATCKVKVVTGNVTLDKSEASLEKGKTLTLNAKVTPTTLADKSVTWTSSDTKIATVSSTGKVKGVKYGTATITCTSNATGLSATCTVTVGKVVISMSEFSIKKSRAITLEAAVYPSTLSDKSVIWQSSDMAIATVTCTGRVKGIKAGTATITCTSVATGLSAKCTVTVLSTSETRSTDGDDDDMTDIEMMEDKAAAAEPYDVYDMSGRKVLNQTTSLDGLPNGIYIVNGKKILKK